MRFFIVAICLIGSQAMGAVEGFNEMIAESNIQQKRMRRKLLQSIQGTQPAIMFANKLDKIEASEGKKEFPVVLVQNQGR